MAKRGSRRSKPKQACTAGNTLYRELHKAIQLLDNEEYLEARDSLKRLHQEYPENEAVLRKLIKACLEIKDDLGAQYALEQLSKLAPDDREIAISLATCYMCNLKMTLTLRLYRRFLERWPEDERAPQVEMVVAELEPLVFRYLREAGFTEDEFDELGALHDESRILMEYGRYAEGRRMAEELIERKPKFPAARKT
ncbi:MAG: tetratricopeptide repeat protein [Blastocatellia bacterium]|nr:tetratricopeptide repeat protein [Blastocatellia bacterium]